MHHPPSSPLDPQHRALALYQADPDPLLLDAIRVLQDPTDPNYETALAMVQQLEDLLFGE